MRPTRVRTTSWFLLATTTSVLVVVGGVALAARKDCRPHAACWGTSHNDRINGTDGHDSIYGRGGHDQILGRRGGDRVDGGAGRDELYGDPGHDTLVGGPDTDLDREDLLFGGSGRDNLLGRARSDTLVGGNGADLLRGGAGVDSYSFETGWGRDTVVDAANTRNTALFRTVAADLVIILTSNENRPEAKLADGPARVNWAQSVITSVYGGLGDDRIWGSDDKNLIVLIDGGSDDVFAGAGDDVIYANDLYGEGTDTVDCGAGEDVVMNHDQDDVLAENCETRNG